MIMTRCMLNRHFSCEEEEEKNDGAENKDEEGIYEACLHAPRFVDALQKINLVLSR